MMSYWQSLTARERALLVVAGALSVLVLAYFLVVRPLEAHMAESHRVLLRAQNTYAQILAGAQEIEGLQTENGSAGSSTQRGAVSVRVAVAQEARRKGVNISRLQPGSDGGLTVWVEAVPSTTFFAWIKGLSDDHSIAPKKVIAQKSTSEGLLRVQLEFAGI